MRKVFLILAPSLPNAAGVSCFPLIDLVQFGSFSRYLYLAGEIRV